MSKRPSPARSSLPQGAIRCPNCERNNEAVNLVWHMEHGWMCPDCGYADPYWNRG